MMLYLACSSNYCSYSSQWSSDQTSAHWKTVETEKIGRPVIVLREFDVNCSLSFHSCYIGLNCFAGFDLRHCEE